mmetsp:Transcript_967/g.1522  ORF Transcript_967/g.1522 Transcript_967/m.1522 type:complete len:172 (+) Transcript_967:14-529(+)|eukprot:CAMPEP_0119105162 /NCGR_PEP_ID=MMETSP1180-20130426/3201_1 /TAXON_ID=3052 ORGANISM="Chlamydomonas cf sp, Strain CCMP681" /NCGR_SAMPLE_ID=MMETSP1180 /ASSEMBLY_ACC=CAM_ASM_000741 /LENGTH=171 /DNA_ID=CAMNT_0007090147 /DNA_START=9 /DNA_END=524 /DNA_ORIENTATION=-
MPSRHNLPSLATRLRVNRGFESAWYSDMHYALLLQKDWLLSKNAWSLVTRASRSKPKQNLTLTQQLQHLQALREARAGGNVVDSKALAASTVAASQVGQAQGLAGCDYPNLRVARIFTQQLPYKSVVNTFSYAVPTTGAQNKYGLLPNTKAAAESKIATDAARESRAAARK